MRPQSDIQDVTRTGTHLSAQLSCAAATVSEATVSSSVQPPEVGTVKGLASGKRGPSSRGSKEGARHTKREQCVPVVCEKSCLSKIGFPRGNQEDTVHHAQRQDAHNNLQSNAEMSEIKTRTSHLPSVLRVPILWSNQAQGRAFLPGQRVESAPDPPRDGSALVRQLRHADRA